LSPFPFLFTVAIVDRDGLEAVPDRYVFRNAADARQIRIGCIFPTRMQEGQQGTFIADVPRSEIAEYEDLRSFRLCVAHVDSFCGVTGHRFHSECCERLVSCEATGNRIRQNGITVGTCVSPALFRPHIQNPVCCPRTVRPGRCHVLFSLPGGMDRIDLDPRPIRRIDP